MRKFTAFFLAAVISVTAVGCSGSDRGNASVPINGGGAAASAFVGEEIRSGSLGMTVNEVARMPSVSGNTPSDPFCEYLCVNVTVRSISEDTITIGSGDFNLLWEGSDSTVSAEAINQEQFGFDRLPASIDIEQGEMICGNLFFLTEIDAHNLQLQYTDLNGSLRVTLGTPEVMGYPVGTDGDYNYGEYGEKMATSRFYLTVNSARLFDELGDFALIEGFRFLAVDITIQGTADDGVDTGAGNFGVYWGEEDADYCFSCVDEAVADFPVSITLAKGEKQAGEVFFLVPENAEYIEFYHVDLFTQEYTDYTVSLGSAADITAA